MLRSSALAVLGGCVPHLYSSAPDSAGDWDLPENDWPQCGTPPDDFSEEPTGFDEGERFPDARLQDQNGDVVSMWQFTGCVTIVDLSTGWCGPCQKLARQVDDLYAAYEGEGFMYVTLLSQSVSGAPVGTEDLTEWAGNYDVTTTPILADPTYSAQITASFPRILSLDREMRVANSQVVAKEGQIEEEVERLLAN